MLTQQQNHTSQEEHMDLTTIIQVAIGIIFVWVILAVITSQIQDWIASIFKWRSSMLEDTIVQLLGDPALKDKVYAHPLIKGLYTNNGLRKPGGIPKDKFALVLFGEVMKSSTKAAAVKITDAVSETTGTTAENTVTVVQDANLNKAENTLTVVENTITDVENTFKKLKNKVSDLKGENKVPAELEKFVDTLDTLLIGIEEKADDATYSITEARKRVESWFDDSMERLGGAYRRRMQIVAIIAGITIAAALNVDTGAIMTTLWKDPVIRQAVVSQANQLQEPTTTQPGQQAPSAEEIAKNVESLSALSLPIGWSAKNVPTDAGGWAAKAAGILLSGMAAAQGAPYWFDLMRKLLTRNPPVPQQPA
jgi:ElaB/YqjD/DUF883 family membrane-anchored ribosome-binding protein